MLAAVVVMVEELVDDVDVALTAAAAWPTVVNALVVLVVLVASARSKNR